MGKRGEHLREEETGGGITGKEKNQEDSKQEDIKDERTSKVVTRGKGRKLKKG